MKISNILTLIILSVLTASCAKETIETEKNITEEKVEQVDQLMLLKQQTEQNNPFVIEAKKQLLHFVGEKNFDNYVTQHDILKCQNNEKQSECVLHFYLTEYYHFKTEEQVKKAVAEAEKEASKIDNSEDNIKHYCELSADFVNELYTKKSPSVISHYQQELKLDHDTLSSFTTKIEKDNYTHFLINENPTIVEEMKNDFMSKCLVEPKTNIINYTAIFR